MEEKSLNFIKSDVQENASLFEYKWYSVCATVKYCKSDLSSVVYEGCPREFCKKKIIPKKFWLFSHSESDDEIIEKKYEFYCPKCNHTYPDFQYRYKLKVFLEDSSDDMLVTMFDNNATSFLGKTAPELAEIHKSNIKEYNAILESRNNQTFNFTMKVANIEFSNDDVQPVHRIANEYVNGIVENYKQTEGLFNAIKEAKYSGLI